MRKDGSFGPRLVFGPIDGCLDPMLCVWHIELEAKGGFARALHRAFLVGFQVTLGIFQYKQGIFLLNVPRVASAIYKDWSM